MTLSPTLKITALLLFTALVDLVVFQLGYYVQYDVAEQWDVTAALKYMLSVFWSVLFWSLWAVLSIWVPKPRLFATTSGVALGTTFLISAYFKSEFMHLPNVNTYLFSLQEPLNVFVLAREKVFSLSFLLSIPVFVAAVVFCHQLSSEANSLLSRLTISRRRLGSAALVVAFAIVSGYSLGWHRFAHPLTYDANAARIFFQQGLMLGGNKSNLRHPTRLAVDEAPESRVNVLLLLNESLRADALIPDLGLGDDFFPRENAPNWQQITNESNAVVFKTAYANSNTTNVSVPSLLTGLAPQATSTDFHTLPVAWQYAKQAGNQTFLFTSQDWTWEHFDHFFFSKAIDRIFHRQTVSEIPLVNDLGVDDRVTFKNFAAHLATLETSKPYFGVLQYNNTHPPFYGGDSSLELEAYSKERYLRSIRMLDDLIAKTISTVRQFKSALPTLVFLTADHGQDFKLRPVGRHNNFFEEMVRVPFLALVVPGQDPALAAELVAKLKRSQGQVVQNTDLLPTFLELWKMKSPPKLAGHSLLGKLPKDRLVSAVGTCEIRKWSPEGFFLRAGSKKLLVAEHQPPRVFDLQSDSAERQEVRLKSKSPLLRRFAAMIGETPAMKDICARIGEANCEIPSVD